MILPTQVANVSTAANAAAEWISANVSAAGNRVAEVAGKAVRCGSTAFAQLQQFAAHTAFAAKQGALAGYHAAQGLAQAGFAHVQHAAVAGYAAAHKAALAGVQLVQAHPYAAGGAIAGAVILSALAMAYSNAAQ